MKKSKPVKMVIEKTKTGFSAFCEDLPIYTTGISMTELMDNAKEASDLYFEDEMVNYSIAFEIDLKQFFQHYRVLNAKVLAERIGINHTLLSQYVQGRKKPSKKQTEKIVNGIRNIGKELSEFTLLT